MNKKTVTLSLFTFFLAFGSGFFVFSQNDNLIFENVPSVSKTAFNKDNVKASKVSYSKNFELADDSSVGSIRTIYKRISRDLAIMSGATGVVVDQYYCNGTGVSIKRLVNIRVTVVNSGGKLSSNYFPYVFSPLGSPSTMFSRGVALNAGGYINWIFGMDLPLGWNSISVKILPTNYGSNPLNNINTVNNNINRNLDSNIQNNIADIRVYVNPC